MILRMMLVCQGPASLRFSSDGTRPSFIVQSIGITVVGIVVARGFRAGTVMARLASAFLVIYITAQVRHAYVLGYLCICFLS